MAEDRLTGFTTSIEAYGRVQGILLRPAEAVVRYGTLVEVSDRTSGDRYLAMITDVKEETPHPALDVERLRRIYESIGATRLEDAVRVLEEIMSPGQELVRWSSIMKVELNVLGHVVRANGGERLEPYDRPPRPFSRIQYPDPTRLEGLLHHRLGADYSEGGLYLGRLSYNREVRIYLNPARLTTHLSILGQTGSGKTETVKRLVYEVSSRRDKIGYPRGGIIVFDIAGEYTGYPYLREDTVPLLDAVMKPSHYGGGRQPGRLTIIVPYEAARAGAQAQREYLWSGLADMACSLSLPPRLGSSIDVLAFFDKDRAMSRATPGCSRLEASKARYNDAYRLIKDSRSLVILLPLPGFMDVEEMIEVSGATSEYFPLIVSDLASALDLYSGQDVYGVTLMIALLDAHLNRRLTGGVSSRRDAESRAGKILDAMILWCGDQGKRPEDELGKTLAGDERSGRRYFFPLLRYLAWLSYRLGYADPARAGEKQALCSLLGSREGVEEARTRLSDAIYYLRTTEYSDHILSGVLRRLRKVAGMTSDVVDPLVFDAVMSRLMEGFSIVHLAPPSTGNVDLLLSTLIRRLFSLHVGDYDPRRLTVLVVEEAHNLAPAGVDRASKTSLLRIAREGRKWGLSMWLVTQRPAFVDPGVLSQTASSILLRTTNPDDLSTIKRGVESAASDIVDRLPDLEPSMGEALVTGLAAPERRVPLLVMVERLRPAG